VSFQGDWSTFPGCYFDTFPKTSPGKKAQGKTWNEDVARDCFADLRKHIEKKSGTAGPFRIWMDNDPAWRGKPDGDSGGIIIKHHQRTITQVPTRPHSITVIAMRRRPLANQTTRLRVFSGSLFL
jgi:hypothetical protein